jgi:hypothetical protein
VRKLFLNSPPLKLSLCRSLGVAVSLPSAHDVPVNAPDNLDTLAGAQSFRRHLVSYTLRVVERGEFRLSVRLETLDGISRGWCPCFSQYASVRVGDIVAIGARGLTAKGKLNMPRFMPVV